MKRSRKKKLPITCCMASSCFKSEQWSFMTTPNSTEDEGKFYDNRKKEEIAGKKKKKKKKNSTNRNTFMVNFRAIFGNLYRSICFSQQWWWWFKEEKWFCGYSILQLLKKKKEGKKKRERERDRWTFILKKFLLKKKTLQNFTAAWAA